MWDVFKTMRKFTPKSEVDKMTGAPVFPLEGRPAYYYGGGFVVHYAPRRFQIEGIQRIETGDPGEYAVGMYHFAEAAALKAALGLDAFHADDVAPFAEEIIDGAISYPCTFGKLSKWARATPSGHVQEGITQRLIEGKMTFQNRFLFYEQYQFFFYGKFRWTRLAGFQFTFCESAGS